MKFGRYLEVLRAYYAPSEDYMNKATRLAVKKAKHTRHIHKLFDMISSGDFVLTVVVVSLVIMGLNLL